MASDPAPPSRVWPTPPRSATPARPHRPRPISARWGSPALHWPGPGVQHGPYMQHDRRNGPQPATGHHRLLENPCCIPQIPQGPITRQQCSPDGRNSSNLHFPLQSSPQNRIFRAEVHPATPPSGPWWFGVLSGISPAHVGPRGTRIRPRGGPSGQKSKKYTFHTNRAPKSHYLSRSTHQRPPSPAPGAPGPSGMITNPI